MKKFLSLVFILTFLNFSGLGYSMVEENSPISNKSIKDLTFFYCYSLKNLEFSNGLKSIGICSFARSSLKSLIMPNSVTSIGNGAFFECESLNFIKISKGVEVIRKATFYNCISLKSIKIPQVVSIEESAFYNCSSLKSITVSNYLESLGDNALFGTSSLERVIIKKIFKTTSNSLKNSCISLIESFKTAGSINPFLKFISSGKEDKDRTKFNEALECIFHEELPK